MDTLSLNSIDTSYWLTKDKDWKTEREKQWTAIEKSIALNLNKAEVNVTKAYFLRGKLPNWDKYRDWEDLFRPLDLMLFLWLHPSDDPETLKNLYKSFMESALVHPQDITKGYYLFLQNELSNAPGTKKNLEDYQFPYMGSKNISLFRILFEDVVYAKEVMHRLSLQHDLGNSIENIFSSFGYLHFVRIWKWLMHDLSLPQAEHCLYQYGEVLEWCMTTLTEHQEQEFLASLDHKVNQIMYQKALYCICHFDEEKQEDSCRSRALVKVRQLLDEGEFVPEFKQMWEGIKSGEIEVKNPWKRR